MTDADVVKSGKTSKAEKLAFFVVDHDAALELQRNVVRCVAKHALNETEKRSDIVDVNSSAHQDRHGPIVLGRGMPGRLVATEVRKRGGCLVLGVKQNSTIKESLRPWHPDKKIGVETGPSTPNVPNVLEPDWPVEAVSSLMTSRKFSEPSRWVVETPPATSTTH